MDCHCRELISKENIDASMLVGALFFLMTRYARTQDKALVQPIMDHFDSLANHPDFFESQLMTTFLRFKKSWALMSKIQT